MDDVTRVEPQQNRRMYRDVNLIRGDDLMARHQRVRILHFPPPLMAGDLDLELRRLVGGEVTDIASCGHTGDKEREKSCCADDQACPHRGAQSLLRCFADIDHGVTPTAHVRSKEKCKNGDVEGEADPEEDPPESGEMRGLRAGWIERRLYSAGHHFFGSSARRGCISSERGDRCG